MKSIQDNVHFVLVRNLTKLLISVADEKIREVMEGWDYKMRVDAPAAAIFAVWYKFFKEYTFSDEFEKEELGDLWKKIYESTLEYLATHRPNSDWFDDKNTSERENATIIARKALNAAIEYLKQVFGTDDVRKWRLGGIHKLHAEHVLGRMFKGLNYPEVEVPGWTQCVNNIAEHGNSGPSWRMILNFANLSESLSVIPGGQSGNPFSEHYADQLNIWIDGNYKTMDLPSSPEGVKNVAYRLIFEPAT